MNSPNFVFASALVVISIGYILKSLSFVTTHDAKNISKFLMHTTFPALVFSTMIKVQFTSELLWLPIICILFALFCSFVGFHIFKKEGSEYRGILTMGCSGYNLGLFAYPLIEGIWGWKGLTYAAMFDIGNSFINFILTYGMGNYLSAQAQKGQMWKHVFKRIMSLFPFQAMVIGLLVNLLEVPMPFFLTSIVDTIAQGNKPLVLLLMGIYFSIRLPKKSFVKVFQVLGIRYILGLSIGLFLFYSLPFDAHFRNMMLICLILPVGMTLITYSDELNFDTSIAGALVNFSMLISFALMWILVGVFQMATA
ncbi:MAG: AEC family transporter [Aquirufa sp.]